MGMTINTNIQAINAQRNLSVTSMKMAKAMERLSSGFRINRVADDAAGLAISEKLRSQIRGLSQASRNAQDGVSMVQTAEGALSESHSILQRMRELAVQASTSTLTDSDRTQVQEEVSALIAELDRIGNSTTFNGVTLLNGGLGASVSATAGAGLADGVSKIEITGAAAGTYYLEQDDGTAAGTASKITVKQTNAADAILGIIDNITKPTRLNTTTVEVAGIRLTLNANLDNGGAGVGTLDTDTITVVGGNAELVIGPDSSASNKLTFAVSDMRATALGVNTVSVATQAGAQAAIATIDTSLASVTTQRAKLGAIQNRLEHTVASLGVAVENLSASDARIRDADIAQESSNLVTAQILQQAVTAVLAQANSAPQSVLALLRG